MKKLFWTVLMGLFIFACATRAFHKDLADFGEDGFCRLMEREWAREVFDLEEGEAREVFGENGEDIFL